jgi:flagellin-like protein
MKKKRFKKKSGLSPVITTVLLIALTIVITAVVFLWFRGMVEEGVTKFGKDIKLVCDDVQFDVSYSSGTFSMINTGNIPIFRVDVKMSQAGNSQTREITELTSNWPEVGLTQGGSFSADIGSEVSGTGTITVFPVLIGNSNSGKKTYVCGGQYGKELSL